MKAVLKKTLNFNN